MSEYLWYIPNIVEPGHRGDDTRDGWGSIEYSTDLARTAEQHGWGGALLGTGWGRPDTFTVATALAARTATFKPLIAICPGYWQPAHFASAAATLDQLSRGRVLVNIVSGLDHLAAYGDVNTDPAQRYARTAEFLQLVRRLWTEEDVTLRGEHFSVESSTVTPRPYDAKHRLTPHAVLRRGFRAGGTGVRGRGGCPAVLGGTTGRARRTDRPAQGTVRHGGTPPSPARVRPAHHHARP
jgi:alkanesulfonate monooxygenase